MKYEYEVKATVKVNSWCGDISDKERLKEVKRFIKIMNDHKYFTSLVGDIEIKVSKPKKKEKR